MGLYVVATPIGHPDDISLRALNTLKACEIIIGEEKKEVGRLISQYGLGGKKIHLLNEHTRREEVMELFSLCRAQDVALVTDCGTPSFCDPGFQLVNLCRNHEIPVTAVPGASSLTSLLALSSQRLETFLFRGFLPANSEDRQRAWSELRPEVRPIVLMDTPYRLERTLDELAIYFPQRRALLAINLTQPDELILEAKTPHLTTQLHERMGPKVKAEFILLLYATPRAAHGQR